MPTTSDSRTAFARRFARDATIKILSDPLFLHELELVVEGRPTYLPQVLRMAGHLKADPSMRLDIQRSVQFRGQDAQAQWGLQEIEPADTEGVLPISDVATFTRYEREEPKEFRAWAVEYALAMIDDVALQHPQPAAKDSRFEPHYRPAPFLGELAAMATQLVLARENELTTSNNAALAPDSIKWLTSLSRALDVDSDLSDQMQDAVDLDPTYSLLMEKVTVEPVMHMVFDRSAARDLIAAASRNWDQPDEEALDAYRNVFLALRDEPVQLATRLRLPEHAATAAALSSAAKLYVGSIGRELEKHLELTKVLQDLALDAPHTQMFNPLEKLDSVRTQLQDEFDTVSQALEEPTLSQGQRDTYVNILSTSLLHKAADVYRVLRETDHDVNDTDGVPANALALRETIDSLCAANPELAEVIDRIRFPGADDWQNHLYIVEEAILETDGNGEVDSVNVRALTHALEVNSFAVALTVATTDKLVTGRTKASRVYHFEQVGQELQRLADLSAAEFGTERLPISHSIRGFGKSMPVVAGVLLDEDQLRRNLEIRERLEVIADRVPAVKATLRSVLAPKIDDWRRVVDVVEIARATKGPDLPTSLASRLTMSLSQNAAEIYAVTRRAEAIVKETARRAEAGDGKLELSPRDSAAIEDTSQLKRVVADYPAAKSELTQIRKPPRGNWRYQLHVLEGAIACDAPHTEHIAQAFVNSVVANPDDIRALFDSAPSQATFVGAMPAEQRETLRGRVDAAMAQVPSINAAVARVTTHEVAQPLVAAKGTVQSI